MRLLMAQVPPIARRAVQVPTKRFGTVTDDAEDYVTVLIDGDEAAISVLNGTGALLLAGARVVVDFYPPHGALVSGILGVVAQDAPTEQTFRIQFDVAPSATVSVSAATAWVEQGAGQGWTADAFGKLVCDVPGDWSCDLQVGWQSRGTGTHRAGALRNQAATLFGTISSQFTPQAAGVHPTAGYGLAGSSWARIPAAEGDTLDTQARQDSDITLNVTFFAHLRLMVPA